MVMPWKTRRLHEDCGRMIVETVQWDLKRNKTFFNPCRNTLRSCKDQSEQRLCLLVLVT